MQMWKKIGAGLSSFWLGFLTLGSKQYIDFLGIDFSSNFSAGFLRALSNLTSEFVTTALVGLCVIWTLTYIFRENIEAKFDKSGE
tara:strand:+ start:312 stop:566 length:255 start_codon:yes stop_codon:yes gene_type:complete